MLPFISATPMPVTIGTRVSQKLQLAPIAPPYQKPRLLRLEVTKKQQRGNLSLMWLIFLFTCFYVYFYPLLWKGGIQFASSPLAVVRSAVEEAKRALSKAPPISGALHQPTETLKISGYWALPAGRGDKFANGRFVAGSPWGSRESPGGIGSIYHQGQDIPAPQGTPLYAVGVKAEKVQVICLWSNGGGNQAKLSAPSYSRLGIALAAAHLVSPCKSGTYTAGQVFGFVGNTGYSTGPHLHAAQKQHGKFVPPQRWGIEAMLSGKALE